MDSEVFSFVCIWGELRADVLKSFILSMNTTHDVVYIPPPFTRKQQSREMVYTDVTSVLENIIVDLEKTTH